MDDLEFPPTPAPGDTYSKNGYVYTYNGAVWIITEFNGAAAAAPVEIVN